MLYSKKIAAGAIMAGTLVLGSLSGTAALASNAPTGASSDSKPAVTTTACTAGVINLDAASFQLSDGKTITLSDGTVVTITCGELASAVELKLDPATSGTDSGNAVTVTLTPTSTASFQTSPAQPEE